MSRLAVFLVLAAGAARASLPEFYGDGARATGMGGAMVATASDGSAAFYNPALLAFRSTPALVLNTAWTASRAEIKSLQADRNIDTTYAQSPQFFGGGLQLALPIGGKLQNRVALGLDLYTPATRLLRARAPDPDRPYLYMHFNGAERMVAVVSAGVRVLDTLSLGLGAQILADLEGAGANVGTDLFGRQVSHREIDSGLTTKAAPVVGLAFAPAEGVKLGLSYRGRLDQRNHIPAFIDLEGVGVLAMDIEMRNHFTPDTFSLGVAVDPSPELTLALDASYGMWSAAPSPYTRLNVDLGGATLEALGLDESLDLASPEQAPGFADTLTVRGGLEWRASEVIALRAGGGFRPTPVPRQSAPGTNLLDANTVLLSGGLGFRFRDPLELFEKPLQLDLAGHTSLLLPREATKEPTDDVPSYRYWGAAFGAMASLRYDF